jgi:hypothetical protein
MEMSVNLLCVKGPYAGQTFLIDAQGIVLGRDPATSNIVLDVSSVSRSHANVFISSDGRVVLQDLRSTNGTFLIDPSGNNAPVQGDAVLAYGQRFSLGGNDEIVFEIQDMGQADHAAAEGNSYQFEIKGSEGDASKPIWETPQQHKQPVDGEFASAHARSGAPFPPLPEQPAPYNSPPESGTGYNIGQPWRNGVNMRGTSNAPLILGIVGNVLMIPGIFCSACAGGMMGLGSGGGFESGVMWGLFFGILPIICGTAGAITGKSKPTFSFILLLLAAIIAGGDWFATLFTDLFYLAALILYLIGAIMALVQKKEPADAS